MLHLSEARRQIGGVSGRIWLPPVPAVDQGQIAPSVLLVDLNPVYFENRSFSSLWSRWCLTQKRSAMVHGSWLMRASNAATRRVRACPGEGRGHRRWDGSNDR